MLNKNVMSGSPDEYTSSDLSEAPEPYLAPDPQDNTMAMLGQPEDESGEVSPEMAGPAAPLAFMGMMAQGAQGLAASIPGFIPMEVTMWLQQAMQQLPMILQTLQASNAGAMGLGMGPSGMGGAPPMAGPATAGLGPAMGAQSAPMGPSGPPRPR